MYVPFSIILGLLFYFPEDLLIWQISLLKIKRTLVFSHLYLEYLLFGRYVFIFCMLLLWMYL